MIEGRFSSSSGRSVSGEKLRYFIIPGQVIQSAVDGSFDCSDTCSSFKYRTKYFLFYMFKEYYYQDLNE